MQRHTFVHLAADTLGQVDDLLETYDDPNLDVELAGDVMTVRFSDGARYVINWHSAAQQIWMAAETHAWHFDYDQENGRWVAAKNGDELLSTVRRVVQQKLTDLK